MFKGKPSEGDLFLDLDGDMVLVVEVKNMDELDPPNGLELKGRWWTTLQCVSGENSEKVFYADEEGFASGFYIKAG